MDRILPPPPTATKPRNESMSSSLPTYRNRPGASANASSQFANAKSIFETLNKPAVRNGLTKLAQNPLVQKAAIAVAKDDRARSAAINAAHTSMTGKKPDETTTQISHGAIKGMVKQFENKPIMGMNAPNQPSVGQQFQQAAMQSTFDSFLQQPSQFSSNFSTTAYSTNSQTYSTNTSSYSTSTTSYSATSPNYSTKAPDYSTNSYSTTTYSTNTYAPTSPPDSYKNLTAIDPFEYPPQLPSDVGTAMNQWDPFDSRKSAPARPPPPKVRTPDAVSPEPTLRQSHAIVKYPYQASQYDELTCNAGDTVLLQKEVDSQWVEAMNTRTGQTGMIPQNYLEVKIPLAPKPKAFSPPPSQQRREVEATHDFQTGVDGDLNFTKGSRIIVHGDAGDEWLRGELNGRIGIFPANHVKDCSGYQPTAAPRRTATAQFDYKSDVAEDLCFAAGDQIEIVEEVNAEWIRGYLHGRTGLVPVTYIQRD